MKSASNSRSFDHLLTPEAQDSFGWPITLRSSILVVQTVLSKPLSCSITSFLILEHEIEAYSLISKAFELITSIEVSFA